MPKVQQIMTNVFISSARNSDENFVRRLRESLRRADFAVTCWVDREDPPDWELRLDAISHVDIVLIVLNHAYVKDEWVWREAQWAETQRKPIVPLLTDVMPYPDNLIACYRTIDFANFDFHESLRGLIDQINAIGSPNALLLQQIIRNQVQTLDTNIRPDKRAHQLSMLIIILLRQLKVPDDRMDEQLADRLAISERFAQSLLKATFPIDELDDLFIAELAEALECDPDHLHTAIDHVDNLDFPDSGRFERPDAHPSEG